MRNKEKEKNTKSSSFRRTKRNRRGFTLLEMLLAVFIFSLVMITVVALFTRFVTFQKRSRSIQRNMENSVYVMELMAKMLRTSSVVSCNNFTRSTCNAQESSIEIYDYSQNKCIRFYSQNNIIKMGSAVTPRANCSSSGVSLVSTDLANNFISNLDFRAIKTDDAASRVGKVTISLEVCSNGTCSGAENDRANLQTTVSLRDYQGG